MLSESSSRENSSKLLFSAHLFLIGTPQIRFSQYLKINILWLKASSARQSAIQDRQWKGRGPKEQVRATPAHRSLAMGNRRQKQVSSFPHHLAFHYATLGGA
jgi:hypothetical protein